MPKGRRRPIVPVQLDKTGQQTGVSTITTSFKVSAPQISNFTFVDRKRIRSLLIKTVPTSKGWRPPTAYRSAAVQRIGEQFHLRNVDPRSSVTTIEGRSRPVAGNTYGYAPADSLFFTSLGVPNVSANTQNQAETEALNKLRDARIDLGAMLAESRETVNFIADMAQLLYYILWEAKRGRWDRIGRLLGHKYHPRTAAEAWLAYAFGIQPIVSDIYGAMEAFKKGLTEKDALIHVSRTVRNTVTPVFIPTGSWTWATQRGRVDELCKVVIYAKIADSTIAALSSWGVINPAAAIWEGLGWSFLVDWLLPIGNFLQALGSTAGLTFVGGTKTIRLYANLTYEIWPFIAGTTLQGSPCVCKYKALATSRTVYNDWPTAWPYIKNPISTQHTSIVGALIVTGLKDFRFATL